MIYNYYFSCKAEICYMFLIPDRITFPICPIVVFEIIAFDLLVIRHCRVNCINVVL